MVRYTGGKKSLRFFKFDICEYYPSITLKLLNKALKFASSFVQISDLDINVIPQSRETLLFYKGEQWIKKKGTFDCAMGSFDGAKCCELIGLCILNKLTTGKFAPFKSSQLGLYRDDGLAVVKIRGRQGGILNSLRKKEIEIFKKEELNITVEHGMVNTDFLDVRLDLGMAEYRPFRKENDCPEFIMLRVITLQELFHK